MLLNWLAENKIKEAIGNGSFEQLEGMGKPVDNSVYFSYPKERRLSMHLLRNANALPEEVQLMKEINALKDAIRQEQNDTEINKLTLLLYQKQDHLAVLMERNK
ncbi:DUF1992 domain-containing protein [Limibacter armeniacum]|uniref:DnaJ family domain-containing protein n=1 Tax=Limibacter armeniacum TaxID=466084 RepID=UPI002FE62B08